MTTLFILLAFGIGTHAEEIVPYGTFVSKHDISDHEFASKGDCETNKGKWDQDKEICFFEVEDIVTITKNENGYDTVSVLTQSKDGYDCEYTAGQLKWTHSNKLLAVESGDDHIQCEVTLTFEDSNTLSVTSPYETCRWFCGGDARLAIKKAIKK